MRVIYVFGKDLSPCYRDTETRRHGDTESGLVPASPRRRVPASPDPRVPVSSKGRPAFTLVEMLIVVSILLIITVAVVAVAPRFTDDRKLSRAADQLAQILLTAKQRAKRDQVPTGVRLFSDPQHNSLVTELQYIQQPDDFGPTDSTVLLRTDLTIPAAISNYLATVSNWPPAWTGNVFLADSQGTVDFTGGFSDPTLWPVQVGDYLNVNSTAHLIMYVIPPSPGPPASGSMLILAPVAPFQPPGSVSYPGTGSVIGLTNTAQISSGMIVAAPWGPSTIQSVNNTSIPQSITTKTAPNSAAGNWIGFLPSTGLGQTPYSIIRRPRVLQGETPLQLPAGICIDPTPKFSGDTNGFTAPLDIMFSPQGSVVNLRGVDSVVLWVRDYTKDVSYPAASWPPPGSPGDQFLIQIQTHTGFIAEHPVDVGSIDPYSFTKDARSSGL